MLKVLLLNDNSEKESRKKQNMPKKSSEKSIKDEVKSSKRNRPRIFSRDFNQLPVSCSPSL